MSDDTANRLAVQAVEKYEASMTPEERAAWRAQVAATAELAERTFTKVTEVVGRHHDAHYEGNWISKAGGGIVDLEDLLPDVACAPDSGFSKEGPRGHFKITVEFVRDA